MSLPEIAFLTMVCGAFSALAVTLGWATWYCRDRESAKRVAPAFARSRRPD
jgi:hypothetical protein